MTAKPISIGDLLRNTREMGGFGAIESFCKTLSVNKNTLQSYETGKTLPDIEFLAVFAERTNTDFGALLRLRLASGKTEEARRLAEEEPRALYHADIAGDIEDETEDVDDEPWQKKAAQYKEGLDLAFEYAREDPSCNPAAVWASLIMELATLHGLEPSGVKRLWETLARLKKRENSGTC